MLSCFSAKASALIVAGLFEGEIVRRAQRLCKRGMLQSAAQDDMGEQMNLPCRREAEPHAPRSATKFGFQILALGSTKIEIGCCFSLLSFSIRSLERFP